MKRQMANDVFDTRFVTTVAQRKSFLVIFADKMNIKQLQMIMKAAEKLEVPDYKTRPAVDVLYDIAVKLSILEVEVISPEIIINRIEDYLINN